jgi:deoxyribonuclease V
MRVRSSPVEHAWDLSPAEARALQIRLAEQVVREDRFDRLQTVAGADCGFPRREGQDLARAAVVLLGLPALDVCGEALVEEPVRYPYVPGLLSFREAPAIQAALQHLPAQPDMILVDGHGLAHPRRFGIACHLGLLLDCPAIGCAKSPLVGKFTLPADEVGAWTPLEHRGERIGAVLRTRRGVKPVFVSIGHRVSLESAIRLLLSWCRSYRLPEPTRLADQVASRRGIRYAADRDAPPPT